MELIKEIALAAEAILEGKICLLPTDTIWGISCNAKNIEAIGKIRALKRRAAAKSFIILVPSIKAALQYTATPPIDISMLQFSRPTTIIFPNAINLPQELISEDGSIGIRIPKFDYLQQLLQKIKVPLVSTSPNISGTATPATFGEIAPEILAVVGFVAKSQLARLTDSKPSTIVKIIAGDQLQVLRP